jgi:SAM-dependent methyltransferase
MLWSAVIKVLRSWLDIGEACTSLAAAGLPRHSSPEKNWDLFLLQTLLRGMPKDRAIVDLGCGDLSTLKLLDALGFRDLHGVDLSIPVRAYVSQTVRMLRRRTMTPPFHLHRGDMTRTHFPDATFDLATCISVIEHGVDVEAFFREVARILKPAGRLLVTTDYWEDGIEPATTVQPFGLPWTPFSREGVVQLVETAGTAGLMLEEGAEIPPCRDRCVVWNGRAYTFIALVLRRP